MSAFGRLRILAFILLASGWLAADGSNATGQIPPRGLKARLPKQDDSPLVGKVS